ncbi:MAG: EAL domain-containing protein [Methylotenera sp.]|uniref:bifunctional diguanylate cyclase/phosphodiesterase n=1 Tax=Methylotenera sp. TaxID=2051956 RepID=UPI00272FB8C3|nr:bifunctional diguanylate cyclase/phosphodiesterase [Methylotenera sp.]MDP1524090.1 EAL domain-containing protein [Methylotenera sp.]
MNIFWNTSLIALSVIVAVAGSFTALAHAARMRHAQGSTSIAWMVSGGITLGMAIWSMHFVGMLAFHLPIPLSYDLPLTLLSAVPAMAAALLGFYVLRTPAVSNTRIFLAGLFMGAGISSMHYIGMAALKMSPAITYNPGIYALSIFIAIAASWIALLMMFRGEQIKLPEYVRFALGSLVMGLAISGMHYTSMQGVTISPGSVCMGGAVHIDSPALAIIVSLVSLLWFGGGILAASFDQRLARHNALALSQLQHLHSTLEKSANDAAASMLHDLSESEKKMRSVVEGALDCIVMMDEKGSLVEFNPAAERTFGYKREEVIGRNFADVIIPFASRKAHREGFERFGKTGQSTMLGKRIELNAMHANGREFPVELAITAFDWTGSRMMVGFLRDITERKKAEFEINNLAFYDPLTKLPNRRLLRERLESMLDMEVAYKTYSAILFIDLDNFKTLNDTRGHDIGDLLLMEVAERLKSCVRSEDTVARLGGDEFVVILEYLSGDIEQATIQAEVVGEKVRKVLGQPYLIQDFDHYSTPSIGISMFHSQEMTVDELLKRADTAMYQAKQAGRNTLRFFDPAMQAELEARAALEDDLRFALESGQLKLLLQMQVNELNQIIGAEALIRWEHPEQGLIYPSQFVPFAEESLLILPIGQWVLETACAQLMEWQNNPVTQDLSLAINVSARQFRQANFVEQIQSTLAKFDISPHKLKLELTESLVFDNIADSIRKMRELRAIGINFAMDDFGTGYASLIYLKSLPLSQIKIDRSFVRDIAVDRDDEIIVQTIISMAHNLGLEVIAEGVETVAQLEFLRKSGCKAFQGHLFSKPVSQAEFNKLISQSVNSNDRFPSITYSPLALWT